MELYSYHVFLFPFQWQFVNKEMHNKTLEERTSLKELIKLFEKNTKWKRNKYKVDTVLNYNEYNYYYSMVREVLFDEGKELDKAIIANLSYDIEPDAYTYNFKVCTDGVKKIDKSYSLHIDSILLHLYSTGVGVLSFHLNNRLKEQCEPDDILNINQAGRRLYPPFFGMDSNLVGTQAQFEFNDFSFGLDILQKNELAEEFSIMSDLHFDDFSAYRNSENFQSNPFNIPRHISFLFQDIPLTVNKGDFNGKDKKVYINPLIDDRMFVVCWYGNDKIIDDLKANVNEHGRDEKGNILYLDSDWWYKFMFNDQKNITCQNIEMKKELIKKHTYIRWSDYGTFYGLNRYSFVCLTSKLDTLKNYNASFIVNHMQTMYYKMAELCLVQRACLLRFSDEVTEISTMEEDKKNLLTKRVGNLNQQYLRFVNKIYFREVTAQEQGIELYDMMQECMKIGNNVKELDQEIKELHSYVSLIENQEQSRNIELLTIIGALFILPTFIINFLGLIILPQNHQLCLWQFWPVLLLLIGPIIYFLIDPKRAKRWMKWLILFTVGVIAISVVLALINH
jgi:Mg2+ and Co2+ transporter CorA